MADRSAIESTHGSSVGRVARVDSGRMGGWKPMRMGLHSMTTVNLSPHLTGHKTSMVRSELKHLDSRSRPAHTHRDLRPFRINKPASRAQRSPFWATAAGTRWYRLQVRPILADGTKHFAYPTSAATASPTRSASAPTRSAIGPIHNHLPSDCSADG